MEVDDHIDAIVDCSLDHRSDALQGKLRILTVVVLYLQSHGGAYHSALPILLEPLHSPLVIEAGPEVMPPETGATQYQRFTFLVAKLCANYLQMSVACHH